MGNGQFAIDKIYQICENLRNLRELKKEVREKGKVCKVKVRK